MKKDQVLLTREGLEKLKKEYEELVNVKRPQVIEAIRTTRAMGDLSENGGYQAAREQQRFIDKRIAELEQIFKTAKVLDQSKGKKEVSVGTTVVLENTQNNAAVTYTIVGVSEADPSKAMISYESPLGEKLLGKKQGDIVVVSTPAGDVKYKIKEIK